MDELIDIGVNLADASFDADRSEVVERAQCAGVKHMVITGTDAPQSQRALEIACEFRLHSTAGIHPHQAQSASDDAMGRIRDLAGHERVVAIGECGLDYYRDLAPRALQRLSLEAQITLAIELELPLFLHERNAAADMLDVLRSFGDALPPAVIHCFTGDGLALSAYLRLGLFIGVTGWVCDERRGGPLRACVADIPSDRLMLETDAPYLLPRTLRPKPKSRRCEPVHLLEVVREVARLRSEPELTTGMSAARCAARFFQISLTRG